jgi:hypothetical protein
MAKQTFTTGQVLTAAQMTALQLNDYNQTVSAKVASYVLVAADAGTRITMSNAGATTITVNTALFAAGDTLFITNIGAGACTITAGTATVSTASSLVLAQYDSGRLYFTSTGVAIWEKYQGAAAGGGGKVLQVVQAVYSTQTANSSATYVSTGLTATITPSATTSKVFVLVSLPMAPNVTIVADATIFRGTTGGTNLAPTSLGGQYGTQGNINMQYLDSPATASAQVYTVASKTSSGTLYSTPTGYTGVITLMEIGA